MVSTTVAATIGVTSLSLGGFAPWADFKDIWLTWWLGDGVGAIIVAPLLILWLRISTCDGAGRGLARSLALVVGLIAGRGDRILRAPVSRAEELSARVFVHSVPDLGRASLRAARNGARSWCSSRPSRFGAHCTGSGLSRSARRTNRSCCCSRSWASSR